MGYTVYVVDDHFHRHFKDMDHHLKHRLQEKYSNPHIENVWVDKINHNTEIFWVHIKTGKMLHHHHFTVVFEAIHHHHNKYEYRLIDVHEGHKSFF